MTPATANRFATAASAALPVVVGLVLVRVIANASSRFG